MTEKYRNVNATTEFSPVKFWKKKLVVNVNFFPYTDCFELLN